jgi:hypothetical protein
VGKGGQLVRGDIHNNFYQVAPSDAAAAELRQAYLGWLVTQANRLPLFVSDDKMVQLPAVYTALLTTASDDSRFLPAAAGAARQPGDGEPRQSERLSALEALDRERSPGADGRTGQRQDDLPQLRRACAWLANCSIRPTANLEACPPADSA